jgi:hypothetical protein
MFALTRANVYVIHLSTIVCSHESLDKSMLNHFLYFSYFIFYKMSILPMLPILPK